MIAIVMCLVLLIICLDHLNLYVVCINGRMYFCYSGFYVVSNECDEPT